MLKRLSVILLTYKSFEVLEKCVETLQKYHKEIHIDFVVINNDIGQSKEVARIFNDIPNTKIITPWYNTYFAGGINLALQEESSDYIAFINDDCYFVDNSLEKMFSFLVENTNEYLAVTGNIYNDDPQRTLTTTSTMLPSVLSEISRTTFIWRIFKVFNFFPQYYSNYQMLWWDRENESRDVESWCDAFMILQKKVFIENGAFFEKLRLYYTEENIGQIAKKLWKKIRYLSNTQVIHNWNYSSKKQPSSKILAVMICDRYWYFYKYHNLLVAFFVTLCSIVGNPMILMRIFSITGWILKLNKKSW